MNERMYKQNSEINKKPIDESRTTIKMGQSEYNIISPQEHQRLLLRIKKLEQDMQNQNSKIRRLEYDIRNLKQNKNIGNDDNGSTFY